MQISRSTRRRIVIQDRCNCLNTVLWNHASCWQKKATYPKDGLLEVLKSSVRLASGQKHIYKVVRVVQVRYGLVQGVHNEQRVILQGTARAQVGFFYGPKLLKHRLHFRPCLEHSEKKKIVTILKLNRMALLPTRTLPCIEELFRTAPTLHAIV